MARDITVFQDFNAWFHIIKSVIPFSKYQVYPQRPTLFDLQEYVDTLEESQDPRLYIFMDYMKPSKRVERYQINNNPPELFIPEVRKQNMPVFRLPKAAKKVVKEEPFMKNKSIFKPWLEDTPASLKKVIECDMEQWKVPKFVKDPAELEKV